jgi:hypothetical protein
MEAVANKYSLVYKIYTKDYCPEKFKYCEPGQQMFQKFNVQVTPSVVAVYRDPQDKPVFQPISNGLVMAEDLIEKLVFYYNYVTTGEHPSS